MFATQPTDILHSISGGNNIEHTLNNWKTCRLTLTAAVQDYISACTDLNGACASSPCQPHRRQETEVALQSIDKELESLASEEAALCKARASLAAARNSSTTLTRIHTLPPEILTSIFELVLNSSMSDAYYSRESYPVQSLAGASTYWRRLAITTPSLWTWIRITADQTVFDYAMLLVDRSNNLPIDLTIHGPRFNDDVDGEWSWETVDVPATCLTHATRKTRSLGIGSGVSMAAINIVLKYWLDHCSAGVTKFLEILGPSDLEPLLHEWGFELSSAEHAEAVLATISVLSLYDFVIPWASTAYRNLNDLRLQFNHDTETQISISQLGVILNSSPNLVNLQLFGMEITPSNDRGTTTIIPPTQLQALYLGRLSNTSCELLLPLTDLSRCLNDLSVKLEFFDLSQRVVHLMQDFLRSTRVRRLVCSSYVVPKPSPQWALSILEAAPLLESMTLNFFGSLEPNELDAVVLSYQSIGTHRGALRRATVPKLRYFTIAGCEVSLAQLQVFVSTYGIQNIHLSRCGLQDSMRSYNMEDMGLLKDQLLEMFPEIECVISEDDTIDKWPGHTFFDE